MSSVPAYKKMKDSKKRKGVGSHEQKVSSALPSVGSRLPTKEAFERYRSNVLDSVPSSVKSRFREGGFCRWGKDWLPVLELGPFDVEPGPVRGMWFEMFRNSEETGRDMKHLVYWYGVSYEERGQAYSFVNRTQLISYEEGKQKGCCELPKKVQNKIANGKRLSRKEMRHMRGLKEMGEDIQRDSPERIKWMMQFQDDYEEVLEESEYSRKKPKLHKHKPNKTGSPYIKDENDCMSLERSSLAMPDEVVSSNNSFRAGKGSILSKRDPVETAVSPPQSMKGSEQDTNKNMVTPELTLSSTVPMSVERKPKQRPTPAECQMIVQELGKLHPDIIAMNNQRRENFALQRQHANETRKPYLKSNGKNTPVTDAIISTLLSQNTTAANQDRAFASLKKAFPGWDQVANETNTSRIEDAIRVAGLAKIRAERMQNMLQTIQEERGEANFEFLQHVQSNDDIVAELSRHKGMGPKTISCVLLFALGRPDFPVDTHVLRISKQMGWVPESFSREAAYEYLNNYVPDECKLDLHCLLVTHGKQCNKCAARGRAQFPPKEQWVCPMAAIKNGKLSAAVASADGSDNFKSGDQKLAVANEEVTKSL